MTEQSSDRVAWHLATWEGAEVERLRQWSQLPLERIIAALEEMQALNDALQETSGASLQPAEIAQ